MTTGCSPAATATQLCRQACRLLPLGAGGAAALPLSSSSRQQVLRAFALHATAVELCCPMEPVCEIPVVQHLTAYLAWWSAHERQQGQVAAALYWTVLLSAGAAVPAACLPAIARCTCCWPVAWALIV